MLKHAKTINRTPPLRPLPEPLQNLAEAPKLFAASILASTEISFSTTALRSLKTAQCSAVSPRPTLGHAPLHATRLGIDPKIGVETS